MNSESLLESLSRVEGVLSRFVAFSDDAQPVALTLWVAHAYAIQAAEATPYIHVHSAERASGKTRTLEVLSVLLGDRALHTVNASPAAVFRVLDRDDPPALLCDEIDIVFNGKGGDRAAELAGVLNAGYRRGALVTRTVGKSFKPHGFRTFGAKVLAGIGDVPETIASRCIPIELRRRTAGERVERFRMRDAEFEAAPIRSSLEAWASPEVVAALIDKRPELPEVLTDRQQDAWEPLLAIADLAGDVWPELSRYAARELHHQEPEQSLGELLLGHVRDVFVERDVDRLGTEDILRALILRDDGPWASWWSKDLSPWGPGSVLGPARRVGTLLKPYGIRSTTIRVGDETPRGYVKADFEDAWARYLAPLVPAPTMVPTLLSADGARS